MFYKIALDGPSGAGKSTLAKKIAQGLNIVYVDTGALYRSIGLYMKNNGVSPDEAEGVIAALPSVSLQMKFENGKQEIYLCGEAVGDSIRTPEISMYASKVSAIPEVRTFLLDTQRDIAKTTSVIMDGRDIGTVIFPDADVKIFLSASLEARARRRTEELAQKGIHEPYEKVLAEMKERDQNDSSRKVAPAVAAKDAILLDNSDLDLEGTYQKALEIIRSRISV